MNGRLLSIKCSKGSSASAVSLAHCFAAGTNDCFFAQATVVYPDAQPQYKLMCICKALEGFSEITGMPDFDFGALLPPGA